MERKHFLGDGLVLRQESGMRPGTGVRNAQQVKVCGDVHLFRVVASKRLCQIEDQFRFTLGEGSKALRSSVENLIERLVTEFLESLEYLFAIFFLALGFFAGFLLASGQLRLGWLRRRPFFFP